jgi:hypothetical protein
MKAKLSFSFRPLRTSTSLKRLELEVEVSEAAAGTAAELLHYKTAFVPSLQPRDPVVRLHFSDWCLLYVHNSETNPEFPAFSDETWFYLNV